MNQLNLHFLQRGKEFISNDMDKMGLSPSRKDVCILTTQIFNAKTKTKTGKTQQVINEMGSYKLNILGISEKRWTEHGRAASGETTIFF